MASSVSSNQFARGLTKSAPKDVLERLKALRATYTAPHPNRRSTEPSKPLAKPFAP